MTLGSFATVMPLADFVFEPNTMKNIDCKNSNTTTHAELRAPLNPVSPLAELFGPSNDTSVCS